MTSSVTRETELQRRLLDDPRLHVGLSWGRPRPGHPVEPVADHLAAMLATIASDDPLRDDLRFLALVRDSFSAELHPNEPWSPVNDHAGLARCFAEGYTADERLLTTLELHDEPYWICRTAEAPEAALRRRSPPHQNSNSLSPPRQTSSSKSSRPPCRPTATS